MGRSMLMARRIEQVLVNLVKNAVDFVPEIGGKITITVEKDQDSTMLFCVEDNGEGVKPEDLGKIFTKFYKGDSKQSRKYGGSGLGLAICQGIIENMVVKYGLTQNTRMVRDLNSLFQWYLTRLTIYLFDF